MRYSRLKNTAFVTFCVLFGISRGAIAIGNSNVQIGGFFSQGYLYSNNNNLPTQDVGGTWDFREAAFNVTDTIGAHLRVGGQVFEQRFGNIGADKMILDWAIADYNFASWFGIRAGRVKYPKGLYGEALDLDVAYVRGWSLGRRPHGGPDGCARHCARNVGPKGRPGLCRRRRG